ncbi:exosome complex protein Rrp42 [Candidatus Woesearchaeota archaeon]|jgi:exosome complex component RRP42|nr:exosome complex protein Rrp42 [Candidatus Woesearchaeota archaeon]
MNEDLRKGIISLLSKSERLDGRKPDQYREVKVETGVSKNAEGSARVKIGDTEVIAGVKLEIMKPYPDAPDKGSLMVNVELFPMSSPEFETGPPDIYAIELARITDRGIRESKTIDTSKLCVEAGEKVWMVVIDVCTINDNGNLFDAIALAALAAVRDAVFPGYDGTTIDYKIKTEEKLPLSKTPVTVTVFKYGDHLLIDPTEDEEKVYDARLTISVLENGNICSLQKGGDVPVSMDEAAKMIELAQAKSQELRKLI